MDATRPQTPDAIIGALLDHAPMKVWSYLVTIFGDLASGPGDEIGGKVLSALTERAGIRPEAMRVALHRLRKDDWIVARRAGRGGLYRLSERGRAQTLRAGHRIYAREVERPDLWHLLIGDPATTVPPPPVDALLDRGDYLKVSGGVLLGTGPCPAPPDDVLTVEFTRMSVPPWLAGNAMPKGGEALYERTAGLLDGTAAALDGAGALAPLDRATIRLLALHHWRRAVLRHSPLIDMLHGDGWAGARCRAAMAGILDRVPRPSSADLLAGSGAGRP